jgi:SAM-dependent methyltransferase
MVGNGICARCAVAIFIVLACAETSAQDAPRTEDLLTRLQRVDSLRLQWRAKAGTLWCKHVNQKVGPTGGFCLSATAPNFGGNQFWSRPLAQALAQLFQSGRATREVSVLDLGCGLGHYGKYFKAHAPGVAWVGLDGSEGIEEATRGLVRFADLDSGMPESVGLGHVPRSGRAHSTRR